MDRDIPSFNRAVMQRIYSKNQQMHLRRLKDIKSGITSHKSYNKPAYNNLTNSNSIIANNYQSKLPQYNNPKRQSIDQINNSKIQRENALLFKKMLKIMKRPDKNNDPTVPRYHVTGNQAKQRMSMEFSRINEENKTLFHRLQQQKPTIDMKKLQEERIKNLQILKFLGKYPNQQAMLRASQQQFQTFDMKSRKMNSTSNRIYYNNLNRESNNQGEQFGAEERFRNQMQGYDRQLKELRDETRRAATRNSRTIEKFTVTSGGNYYNPRRASNSSHNEGGNNQYNKYKEEYANNQLGLAHHANHTHHNPTSSTLSRDEPIPPSRRKFLSQGGHRQTSYNPPADFNQPQNLTNIHQNNYDQQINDGQVNTQMIPQEKYPYHLNHPSNNIVIQDRLQNYYASNSNKRKTLENIREKKGIANSNNAYSGNNSHAHNVNTSYNSTNNYTTHNAKNPAHQPIRPLIPKPYLAPKNTPQNNYQRKLNKKNSQSQIQVPQHIDEQPMIRPQFKILPQQFYHESMQEQQEENFETQPSPQRVNKHVDLTNLKSAPEGGKLTNKEQANMILLYRTVVELGKLVVKEQVQEMASDVQELIGDYNSEGQIKNHPELEQEHIVSGIMQMLEQQLRQITIYRLAQCYKIAISAHNARLSTNPKKRRYQQQSSKLKDYEQNLVSSNPLQQLDPSTLQAVKQHLQTALSYIEQLEIPEQEGSLLLQDIDYNYRHLIQRMVKVEKDLKDNTSETALYRLVIVFDGGQETINELEQHGQYNEDHNHGHALRQPVKQRHIQIQSNQHAITNNNPPDLTPQNHPNPINSTDHSKQLKIQPKQNPDSDQQQTLSKPQAVSIDIPPAIPTNINQPKNHEKSIYVQALDQQVM